jgi:hypothetical protein
VNIKSSRDLTEIKAEKLGVPRMLDEQDFTDKVVDKDTIITYLTSFYHILGEGDVSNSATDQAKGLLS